MTEVVGYASGVFDMFHIGHLNILRRSRERCDHLVAGVMTDEAVVEIKGYQPIVPFDERIEIIRNLRCVDEVISDTSLDKTVVHARRPFDVMFKGTDWQASEKGERLAAQLSALGVRLIYLPYTEHTSSTMLRDVLQRLATSLGSPAAPLQPQ